MTIAVCIPYRNTAPERERNLARVRKAWDTANIPVYLGDCEGGWSRSCAINDAVDQADDADVLLISDSDILLDAPVTQTLMACELALEYDAYVVAFSQLVYLNEDNLEFWRQAFIWGGVFAVPRALFEKVGGFDQRFREHGGEDVAFLTCASTLGGKKQRCPGLAYHLPHPEDLNRPVANLRLANRYREADGNVEEILELIAERP